MSMILLKPANKIIHLNVGIKRRTISLTGFAETGLSETTKGPGFRLHNPKIKL
jgi:hypothetical protein